MLARERLIKRIRKSEKSLTQVNKLKEFFISINNLNTFHQISSIIRFLEQEKEYYQRQLYKLID